MIGIIQREFVRRTGGCRHKAEFNIEIIGYNAGPYVAIVVVRVIVIFGIVVTPKLICTARARVVQAKDEVVIRNLLQIAGVHSAKCHVRHITVIDKSLRVRIARGNAGLVIVVFGVNYETRLYMMRGTRIAKA